MLADLCILKLKIRSEVSGSIAYNEDAVGEYECIVLSPVDHGGGVGAASLHPGVQAHVLIPHPLSTAQTTS